VPLTLYTTFSCLITWVFFIFLADSIFWPLWIVLAMHIGVQIYLDDLYSFLDIYPEMRFLDHMVLLFFHFWFLVTSTLFSILTITFYIPTNCVQGLQFHFPNDFEHSFIYLFAMQMSFLEKCPFEPFACFYFSVQWLNSGPGAC
jgi:hypothetical protein